MRNNWDDVVIPSKMKHSKDHSFSPSMLWKFSKSAETNKCELKFCDSRSRNCPLLQKVSTVLKLGELIIARDFPKLCAFLVFPILLELLRVHSA